MSTEHPKTEVETEVKADTAESLVDDFEGLDIVDLVESRTKKDVPAQVQAAAPEPCIVGDDAIIGLYDEILDNCREDRSKSDEIMSTFMDMVLNDGDASTASKEAIVALMKIRSDTSDKMTRIADLMTRIKLKDKDTFPRYLAAGAQSEPKVVIESSRRDLVKTIGKMVEKTKEGKKHGKS